MKRGGGPKTREGKARSAQNARRHGLAVSITRSEDLLLLRDDIARSIAGEDAESAVFSAAKDVATAEVELIRIRREKERVISADAEPRQFSPEAPNSKITRKQNVIQQKIEFIERREGWLTREKKILDRLQFEYQRLNSAISNMPETAGIDYLVEKLMKLERYETRALSRRRRALNRLAEVIEIHDLSDQNALGARAHAGSVVSDDPEDDER